jgi:threonine dehydratase
VEQDPAHPAHSAALPGDVAVDVPATDVFSAAHRIRQGDGGVQRTSMYRSRRLSALLGVELHLKHEFSHPTGSFKERGGRNALLLLDASSRARGVIAASAGNHALALAYHGAQLGVPVTVVMPTIAPITKVQNCRDLGARVLIHGAHIGEAREMAFGMGEREGLAYINGFDHPHIIAGAGSMGIEIVEQVPDVEAVLVPVGGAGLIAGVAVAIKSLRPDVRIIGVEPANCPSLSAALQEGRPVTVPAWPTLADGLFVPRVGTNAFALAARHVDAVVTVKEKFIALAMLRLLECEKVVVEGGGAVGLAALLEGQLPELRGKKVVLPLCGGNVDTPVLGRVLERGLAVDGRLVRFEALVSDRPGGIAALTNVLYQAGVSIKEIFHERVRARLRPTITHRVLTTAPHPTPFLPRRRGSQRTRGPCALSASWKPRTAPRAKTCSSCSPRRATTWRRVGKEKRRERYRVEVGGGGGR